jgi:hypothetical protein
MNLSVILPLAVALVGLGLYFWGPGKWGELGRLLFFAGMLVLVASLAGSRFAMTLR